MSNQLLKVLESKFDQEADSDLVFVVEGKRIHVHRHYLSLVSTYLGTMLSERWTNPGQQEVTIVDANYPTFYSYLRFLYTGELEITMKNLESLYSLAHLYLEGSLLEHCENFIMNQITTPRMPQCYKLVTRFGSDSIHQRIRQWVSESKVDPTNFHDMLEYATVYQMKSAKRKIENYIAARLNDNLWTKIWKNNNTEFKEIYRLILKYNLERLETELVRHVMETYPVKSPPEAKGTSSTQWQSSNEYHPTQVENWKRIKWYYEVALEFNSHLLIQGLENLVMADFNKKPYSVYEEFANLEKGELREMIEERMLTTEEIGDWERLIGEILKPAFKNGRLHRNREFKDYLEYRLMGHSFSTTEMFLTNKFIQLLRIAKSCEMRKLTPRLMERLDSLIFGSIFESEPIESAVEILQSIINRHKGEILLKQLATSPGVNPSLASSSGNNSSVALFGGNHSVATNSHNNSSVATNRNNQPTPPKRGRGRPKRRNA